MQFVFLIRSVAWISVCMVSLDAHSTPLKPRIVVLTDITIFEPDDQQSLTRLLAHADLYEIEGIVISTSWGLKDMHDHLDSIDIAIGVIDAYGKDLPNLMKRSNRPRKFFSVKGSDRRLGS